MHLFTIIPAGVLVIFNSYRQSDITLSSFIASTDTPLFFWCCSPMHEPLVRWPICYFRNKIDICSVIARMAFGGTLDTQLCAGFTAIIATTSLILAWINIKRPQIDQHRKCMFPVWFYVNLHFNQHFSGERLINPSSPQSSPNALFS